jgi:hypothetical protein
VADLTVINADDLTKSSILKKANLTQCARYGIIYFVYLKYPFNHLCAILLSGGGSLQSGKYRRSFFALILNFPY